jgi:carboxylesterase type B
MIIKYLRKYKAHPQTLSQKHAYISAITMSSKTNELYHTTLKQTLRGKPSSSTLEFLNLKYACIPARYKDSIPNHEPLKEGPDGVVDATHFGPSCPQHRGAQAWDLTLTGSATLKCTQGQGPTEKMDEFECLNLNVTVPKSALDNTAATTTRGRARLLPVFVWVHGGGLSMGSNSWPQYQLRRFVQRSVEVGKPVIGIAINYRVNVFGFLAGKEIGSEGNMGFKDQVQAFRWVKRHVAGFGGDPDNITAAGESAGGISLSTLLCADVGGKGLFERVVVMSGEATLRKWRNTWWQEKMLEDQSGHLKLDRGDAESRRRALLDMDAEELAQRVPLAQHFTATVDNEFFTNRVSVESLMDGRSAVHKPSWCKEFVIGDTAHDGIILKARVLDRPDALERLKQACAKHLTASETQKLLVAYNLESSLPKKQESERLLELVSELRFYLPALAAYRGWKAASPLKRASRYHFHVLNPIDGPFKGCSSHELDVAYLLNNFEEHLDEHNRSIARAIQDHFIRFINGEGWAEHGKVVVFDSNRVTEFDEVHYDVTYRRGRGAILESIGMSKLWRVAEMWQSVRQEEEEFIEFHGESKL